MNWPPNHADICELHEEYAEARRVEAGSGYTMLEFHRWLQDLPIQFEQLAPAIEPSEIVVESRVRYGATICAPSWNAYTLGEI